MNVVLSAHQLGERWGWTGRTVREYALDGRIPLPIDPKLPPRMWRWSVVAVEAYELGKWKVGQVVYLDADPTPADGIIRPSLSAVAS